MKVNKSKLRKLMLKSLKLISGLLVLILLLPLLIYAGGRVVTFFSQAAPIPANIVVDVSRSQAQLKRPWAALSEGGETESNGSLVTIAPITSQVKSLGVRYIRVDHVFDYPYQERIKEIVNSGAIPFIALSYFPPDVATKDTGTVNNWDAWQAKVKALVEDISGKNHLNISNVYYEVWNEPDGEGFGNFNIGTGKDYFTLYQKTVAAVQSAGSTNAYKVGGPALADLRRCTNGLLFVCQKFWLDQFLSLVSSSKVRLDFISWHRYSLKMSDFNEDVNFILKLYNQYSSLPPAEKIITEWGSVPQRDPLHNSFFDAVHYVAAARTFIGFVDMATKFEVRDGPQSDDKGWGIFYYDGRQKPVFSAIRLLNMLRFERVLLSGEGTNVTGIASRDSSGATIILSNYDPAGSNTESVPVKIVNLTPGRYRLTHFLLDRDHPQLRQDPSTTFDSLNGTYSTSEKMLPNSVVLYDLQLIGLIGSTK